MDDECLYKHWSNPYLTLAFSYTPEQNGRRTAEANEQVGFHGQEKGATDEAQVDSRRGARAEAADGADRKAPIRECSVLAPSYPY